MQRSDNTRKVMTGLLIFLLITMIQIPLTAQETEELMDMSLEDLLNVKIETASITARSIREQPGIVSVFTEREIISSGARNLTDILRLIPGFDIESDIASEGTSTVRGIWTMEGKALLLVDGRQINDPTWGNTTLFNHFPVDNIKQIEIIRGPGAAKYGGYAELAVIKITTKQADQEGVHATHLIGKLADAATPRNQIVATMGKTFDGGGFSLGVYSLQGNMSDGVYEDYWGGTWDMADNSPFISHGVNMGLNYKGLDVRFMSDHYRWETDCFFADVDGNRISSGNPGWFASIEYNLKLGDKFTLTPRFSHLKQNQHQTNLLRSDIFETGMIYNIKAKRSIMRLTGLYEFTPDFNLLVGGEYTLIDGEAMDIGPLWAPVDKSEYFLGEPTVSYTDKSFFGQFEFYNSIVNITAGARYADHSGAEGSSFVPRFALTKVMGGFHIKALYAHAYRVGDIEHFNLASTTLKPEKTKVMEFELGYQISSSVFVTANLFDIIIEEPIVYAADNTTSNEGTLGSQGFEMELKTSGSWGFFNANYSYYKTSDATIEAYLPISNQDVYIAAPAHKIALNSNFKLGKKVSLSPSAVYMSSRYDVVGADIEEIHDPVLLLNTMLHLKLSGSVTASLGVYDILNKKLAYIQAYRSAYAPLPGPSREILLKVSFNTGFTD